MKNAVFPKPFSYFIFIPYICIQKNLNRLIMKRHLALFVFQLLVCVLNAQTYTFNMHEMNNTKYRIVVDVRHKKITLTKDGQEVFTDNLFYNYTIDRQKKRIGISFDYDEDAVTEPNGSSFFIISREKGVGIRYFSKDYTLKCDNVASHAATYDQLAKTLFPPPSAPPPPPSNSDYLTFTVNGVSFHMVQVQGGTFTMGNVYGEEGDDDYPDHKVTLSSYMIGQTEVTQSLWLAVMGNNSSDFIGDCRRPVENVSKENCRDFINKLNSLTGQHFRLPTEAEWEFAARGGVNNSGCWFSGSNNLRDVAWYDKNAYHVGEESSDYGTHAVATKQSNELGIYDMSGNVSEWCNDLYDEHYYSISPINNPQGSFDGVDFVLRGGDWTDNAINCRVYKRLGWPYSEYSGFGLRLAF